MNPLIEWLGEGGVPVAQELAESRSKACEACPENRAPRWWEIALDPIAYCILRLLEVKNAMNLVVANEDKLHMCRVCGCCNRLKIWTPLSHIVKHDAPEKFHVNCWIRRES